MDDALIKMRYVEDGMKFGYQFNKRRMRNVEIKKSSIPNAGLGLFARANVKAGTLLTFYPVHAMGIIDAFDDDKVKRVMMDAHTGVTYERGEGMTGRDGRNGYDDDDDDGDENDGAYLLHVFGNRPLMNADISRDLCGSSIYVDVDVATYIDSTAPTTTNIISSTSTGFDGHRVNDGSTILANDEIGTLSYYRESSIARNCVHVPFGPCPIIALVSTKRICKGDELLTTYGCSCE